MHNKKNGRKLEVTAAPYHTNYLYLIPPFYEIMSNNNSRVEENMRLANLFDILE